MHSACSMILRGATAEGFGKHHGGGDWTNHTLPHLGQSPLMTKSASSLASIPAALSPLRRLEARVGCCGSLGLRFSLFFVGGGLYAHGMCLMLREEPSLNGEFVATRRNLLQL